MADFSRRRSRRAGKVFPTERPLLSDFPARLCVEVRDGHGGAVPLRRMILLLEFYFADLGLGLEIGVVGDVGQDLRGVRSPCFDEGGDGVEIHVAERDVER